MRDGRFDRVRRLCAADLLVILAVGGVASVRSDGVCTSRRGHARRAEVNRQRRQPCCPGPRSSAWTKDTPTPATPPPRPFSFAMRTAWDLSHNRLAAALAEARAAGRP